MGVYKNNIILGSVDLDSKKLETSHLSKWNEHTTKYTEI